MAVPSTVQNFPAPPFLSPFWEDEKKTVMSRAWVEWFRKITSTLGAAAPITGTRDGNGALGELLAVLDRLGLIKDETTP